MELTRFVKNLFPLSLLILPFIAVFIFSGCAYHPKSGGKSSAPQWAVIEGEYCTVNLAQDMNQRKAMKLTVGLTAKGNTAICLGDVSTKKPRLVAIADSKECATSNGIKRANERFSNYVVQIASPERAILNIVPEGSELACIDDYKLAGGGSIGIYGSNKQDANTQRPAVALVTESRILAMLEGTGMTMLAPKQEFEPDISAKSLIRSEIQCVLSDWHQNATYGVRREDGVDDPGTLLVCDPDVSAAEAFICQVEVTPELSVGIIGNERANRIAPATVPTACGAIGGAGNNLEVSPPNPEWDLVELWILGWGGSDHLSGIQDPDTINVIWGDYYCGGAHVGGEYMGTGDVDYIYGGPGHDFLFGEEGSDYIWGLDGSDTIYGNNSCQNRLNIPDDDKIWGGTGLDRIYGDSPTFYDEQGNPTGDFGEDTIYGEAQGDTISGGPGDDTIYGDFEPWITKPGDDNLCGNEGADTFIQGFGCDDIYWDAADPPVLGGPCDTLIEGECPWGL